MHSPCDADNTLCNFSHMRRFDAAGNRQPIILLRLAAVQIEQDDNLRITSEWA